ncbi:MAG: hypothetical protein ABII93_02910 [Chrysiogenia bacterium]
MAPLNLCQPERKRPDFFGRTKYFMMILFILPLLVRADVYEKIDGLSKKCQAGNMQACTELSDIAKNDKDGNVRLAAAAKMSDNSLAQIIIASIAKYDKDSAVREAAVEKLTDRDLLANLAQYSKYSSIRLAAERKLNGQDLPAGMANDEEAPEEVEPTIQDNEPAVTPDRKREGADKKIGLYTFELPKMKHAIGIGILGIIEAEAHNSNARAAMPYLAKLRMELIKVAEAALKDNVIFNFIPIEKLEYMQADQIILPDIFITKNDLHASLSVKIESWGGNLAIKKKMIMKMQWKIKNSSGYEVKIKTYCKTKDTFGLFPDPNDPKFEPVLVELAKESTQQLLEKLAVLIEEDKKLL